MFQARHCAALAAVGILGTASAAPASAQDLTPVSIGQVTTTSLTFAPVMMAAGMGYFEDEGLDVEVLEFKGSAVLLPQLTSKRVTVGFPNPDMLILSHQPGRDELPLKFFYNFTRTSAWEFAVLEDSPAQELADLQGKRLGIGALTWGNVPITKAVFQSLDMDEGDYEMVPVGVGGPAFLALQRGEVDALNLFDAQHAQLEVSGTPIRRLEMPQTYSALFSNGFIAHEDTIAEQGEVLAGFGRAVAKGTVACEANPEACVMNFWEYYPNQKPAGDEEQVLADQVRIMQSRFKKVVDFPEGEPRQFGGYDAVVWTDFVQALYDGGQIPSTDVEVEELFTNQFVDEFNEFDADAVVAEAEALD